MHSTVKDVVLAFIYYLPKISDSPDLKSPDTLWTTPTGLNILLLFFPPTFDSL